MELVGTGFLLITMWCWWKSLRAIVRGRRSRSWPAASGVIRSARVVKKYNRKSREVWRQVIDYSYSVDGKVYGGTRLQFGMPNALAWSDPSLPSFHLYCHRESVEVFYSPSRPSISALQRGFSPFVFVTFAAGALMAWMGSGLFNLPG